MKENIVQGPLLDIFQKIGGTVDYFGKPYSLVYNQAADIK